MEVRMAELQDTLARMVAASAQSRLGHPVLEPLRLI